MSFLLNAILFCVFCGLCCSYFAEKQGRNKLIWFAIGFSFPLLAALLLIFLPRPQRRRARKKPEAPKPSENELKTWFYINQDKENSGPIDFYLLNKTWKSKEINENSYIWSEGMDEWSKIKDHPSLHNELIRK